MPCLLLYVLLILLGNFPGLIVAILNHYYRFIPCLVLLLVLLLAGEAHAASIRLCWDDVSTQPDAQVQAWAGTTSLASDVLVGSNLSGTTRCTLVPMLSSLPRNVDLPVTLKGVNALGEVGPASAPVTFRAPLVPAVVTGLSVQAVAP